MVFEHQSYRTFLKELLALRQRENARYSLRAMASSLGFSGSQISEVMNNKANFSEASLKKIAKKLKLSRAETDYLCLLGALESESELEARAVLLVRLQKLNPSKLPMADLTIDQFKQISDWHHSAILELVELKGFTFCSDAVAKKIRISKAEADLAIERLKRLELIEQSEDGKWKRLHSALQIRSEEKNSALRKFYRQMFEKASQALDEQTPQERWSGYETIPIAKEALPEIRAACDAFFDEVLAIANKYENKTEVYHMLTHVFSLTKNQEKL